MTRDEYIAKANEMDHRAAQAGHADLRADYQEIALTWRMLATSESIAGVLAPQELGHWRKKGED